MLVANIYPVKNQEMYQQESFVMILAHLVKKGLYKPSSFNKHQYIIMDNGLYEEEQVSTDLKPIIDLANNSGIPVNEIIIPDVINDPKETIRLFEENLDIIKKHKEYMFMFVAQAKTVSELKEMINYINLYQEDVPNLTVGISKLSPLDRGSQEVIDVLKTCTYPIHYLGIKTTFRELDNVRNVIRSCDTSQVAYIAKNEASVSSVVDYTRSGRRDDGRGVEGVDIDLEHDQLNNDKLQMFRNQFLEEF